jgi:hypothetical protein
MANEPQSAPGRIQDQPRTTAPLTLEFIDRPDVTESYADSIHSLYFDGQSLKLTFCVTRMNEPRQDKQASGKRYPSCRLVLSVSAAVELMNRMRQISAALTNAGFLKEKFPQPVTEK